MNLPILQLRNVTKRIGSKTIVDGAVMGGFQ